MHNKCDVISKTEPFVRQLLKDDCTGHDWWHVDRVRKLALFIANDEPMADKFIVELIALLHDVDDWKFTQDNEIKTTRIESWLQKLELDIHAIIKICDSIQDLSFKGAKVDDKTLSLEAQIVQDADRLDAMGAIGIARTFAFGGHNKRKIHDPNITPHLHQSFAAYKQSTGTTINHFHEKLLLLKDRMNTKTAMKIAQRRHSLMESYLTEFHNEWDLPEFSN